MPEYLEYTISRADLPKDDPEFPLRRVGLEEADFDLTNAKAWVDDQSVGTMGEKGQLILNVPRAWGKPLTIAVTTKTAKLIGILEGNKIPVGKETTPAPSTAASSTPARSSTSHSHPAKKP